jgi:hypothetical protein
MTELPAPTTNCLLAYFGTMALSANRLCNDKYMEFGINSFGWQLVWQL